MGDNSIRIDTGVKRIAINDDPKRIIEFNPQDVVFAERFYGLIRSFEDAQERYLTRAEELDADEGVDQYGLATNAGDRLALLREICEFLRGQVDQVFGEGTSQTAFGDTLALEVFEQFFQGILPFIEETRKKKIVKYSRQAGKKTMK